MSYPDLPNDLEVTLKTVLWDDERAPEVVRSYFTKSKTKAVPSTPRPALRVLRIISSPDDDQKQRLDGKDDLVLLRWNTVKNYVGSTADSVVKTIGSVVP